MRQKSFSIVALVVLLLSTIVSVYAGPTEDKFGIGEADLGGTINWSGQTTQNRNSYDWDPDSATGTRNVWYGPDVIGSYVFAHSPDTYSEGNVHFGPTYTGKTSNGVDPLVDGLDVYWLGGPGRDDVPRDGEYRAPFAYHLDTAPNPDARYNLNAHSLRGPGTIHMHDTNNDGYINCFDIAGFNPNDGVNTCDGFNNRSGLYDTNGDGIPDTWFDDGVYVEDLTALGSFIQANPGKIWVIGSEWSSAGQDNGPPYYRGGAHGIDPFMAALLLWRYENWIHQQDSTAKVYLGDLGDIHSTLNCGHNGILCGDVIGEPGTDNAEDDRGDWWYDVAGHYDNLNIDDPINNDDSFAGFMMDAGIQGLDQLRCINSDTGAETDCGSLSLTTWIRRTFVFDYLAQGIDYPQFGLGVNGQWMERLNRPLAIDHDDSRWGGMAWNAFVRWVDINYRYPLYFLVGGDWNEDGDRVDANEHKAIAEMFTGMPVSVTYNQEWGAAGKSLYFDYSNGPLVNSCPRNPWTRYPNVAGNFNTQATETTVGVGGNDIAAGYAACQWRPGLSGLRVYTSSNAWSTLPFVGTGRVNREYRKDDNGNNIEDTLNGIPDSAGDYLAQVIPSTTGEREDNLMTAGLELELAMRWMAVVGFTDYNVKWMFARATHDMPDRNDGNITGFIGICSGQEYGLADRDGGGFRTPAGEIFWQIRNTANYRWWPTLPATWDASPDSGTCYIDNAWRARPDQTTDNVPGGNIIESGDLPSTW